METRNYKLRVGTKTKIFNMIRKIFVMHSLERLLRGLFSATHWFVLAKLIPPNYLYPTGSKRQIVQGGISYNLDISNVVDHYLYFGYKDNFYDSILPEIEKSNVILDIGANIGLSSLFFSSKNKKAQIFAFEPHPSSFKRAEDHFEMNRITNISLINIGLGLKKETVKLYEVNKKNPGMNRILKEDRDFPHKLIELDSLDNFVDERQITSIDFIKIDVEGHELWALRGGINVLKKSKPVLFLELDDRNLRENECSASQLIEFLLSLGYSNIYRAADNQRINQNMDFAGCHYDIIAK